MESLDAEWFKQVMTLRESATLCARIRPDIEAVFMHDFNQFAKLPPPASQHELSMRLTAATDLYRNWLAMVTQAPPT